MTTTHRDPTPAEVATMVRRPDVRQAVTEVAQARQKHARERAVVDREVAALFAAREFWTDGEFGPRRRAAVQKDLIDLSEADLWTACEILHERYKALGYNLPEVGHCPALMAESAVREAERRLVDLTAPTFGMAFDDLLCARGGLDNLRRFVELMLGLVRARERMDGAVQAMAALAS